MKTKQRQLFRRLGHGASGLRVLMLMLVLLMGGSTSVLAWDWDKTNTDEGGGTYRYLGDSDDFMFNLNYS